MNFILLICALVGTISALSYDDVLKEEWQAFKLEHQKYYQDLTEDQMRLKVFLDNKHRIARHNQLYASGEVSNTIGLNKYADMQGAESQYQKVDKTLTYGDVIYEEWQAFKLEHQKSYTKQNENSFRLKIYLQNRHRIAKHNQLYAAGKVSFTMGLNQFSDMEDKEFQKNMPNDDISNNAVTFIPPANVNISETVDWRKLGAVTPVKDQGQCGDCWAFAAAGSLEGQHFRKTGALISLSAQNLVDCTNVNEDCNAGGSAPFAYDYIKSNGGIDTEKSYPYEHKQHQCRFNANNIGATIVGYTRLTKKDEQDLMKAVATIGPIYVSMDASLDSFHFYKSGVYYDPACSSDHLHHAVLVVGYGTDSRGGDYWLIKNSWNTNWGENGYGRIARNQRNHCGLATRPTYPIV